MVRKATVKILAPLRTVRRVLPILWASARSLAIVTSAFSRLAREAQEMRVAHLAFYESPLCFDTLQCARQSGYHRPTKATSNLLMIVKNLIVLR